MKRITRDHTVSVQSRHEVREPVAEVELGERFIVETINFRTPIVRTVEDANPAKYREREDDPGPDRRAHGGRSLSVRDDGWEPAQRGRLADGKARDAARGGRRGAAERAGGWTGRGLANGAVKGTGAVRRPRA